MITTQRLTGLPAATAIQEELVRAHRPFAISYVDVRSFGGFNRLYGSDIGDCLIRYLAYVLLDAVRRNIGSRGMVGHLGGDDFVVITPNARAEQVITSLHEQFFSGLLGEGVPEVDKALSNIKEIRPYTQTLTLVVELLVVVKSWKVQQSIFEQTPDAVYVLSSSGDTRWPPGLLP